MHLKREKIYKDIDGNTWAFLKYSIVLNIQLYLSLIVIGQVDRF